MENLKPEFMGPDKDTIELISNIVKQHQSIIGANTELIKVLSTPVVVVSNP